MNTQRWILTLLLSLSVALVSFAWLTRPTFCLDSRLVEKIDMVTAEGTESIHSCKSSIAHPFSPTLMEFKARLEAKLRFLERSFEFMQVAPSQVRISIVDSLDPLIRVHPSHLILDRRAIDSEQVLEKSVLLAILLQKQNKTAAKLTGDEALWTEVFSDLFLAFETGSLSLHDPIFHQTIQWKGRRIQWPYSLRTSLTYCHDGWRSFFHISDCLGDDGVRDHLMVSLRPLLGTAMFEALRQRPVVEQIQWFRDVWNHWPDLRIERHFYGSTIAAGEKQELADAARGMENWMRNIRMWSQQRPAWKPMASALERHIQAQGFRDQLEPLGADLVVMAGESTDEWVLKSMREAAFATSKKTVLFIKEEQVYFLPDLKPFPRSWLGEIKARQGLMIQCETPSIELFKELPANVQKVMLIPACESPDRINWTSIMNGKTDGFIRDNPALSFIQFDVPSLRSALARKNLNPIPLLAEKQWNSPFFHEIGWLDPEWDKHLQAYRSRATIDAIEIFRFL